MLRLRSATSLQLKKLFFLGRMYLFLVLKLFTVIILLNNQIYPKLQEKHKKNILFQIYQERTLVDFEKSIDKDFILHPNNQKKHQLMILTENSAPIIRSKKYLGWLIHPTAYENLHLNFIKPLIIHNHVRKIFIWVYGSFLPGMLSILIEDSFHRQHILKFGRLKFRGWKQLQILIPDHIVQKNRTLNANLPIKILKLIYAPGSLKRYKSWQFVFIDDLSIVERKKYLLPKE